MTRGLASIETAAWRRVLRGCAVALVVLLAVQALRYVGARGAALPADLASEVRQAAAEREDVPDVKDYEAIVEEEHFGKKPKPPRLQLFGILGDSALIGKSPQNAKLHKADAKLSGDHVLVEVGADYVVIEREGKRQTLKLFGEPIYKPEPEAGPAGEEGPQGDQPGPPEMPDTVPVPPEGARTHERRP